MFVVTMLYVPNSELVKSTYERDLSPKPLSDSSSIVLINVWRGAGPRTFFTAVYLHAPRGWRARVPQNTSTDRSGTLLARVQLVVSPPPLFTTFVAHPQIIACRDYVAFCPSSLKVSQHHRWLGQETTPSISRAFSHVRCW